LSQGEYIAAEKVEGVYNKSPVVGQLWVYGNSTKSFVVAVVVPNIDALRLWATAQGWWGLSHDKWRTGSGYSPEYLALVEEVCVKHPKETKAWLLAEMAKLNGELNGLERVKDIIVESKGMDERSWAFNEANDLLTPTNKLKRPALLVKYLKPLKQLYADNGEKTNENEKWHGET